MTRAILYPLCVFLCVAAGCASMDSQVVARASRDFSCAREQTLITDQFGGIYRMEGCGFVATYECRENGSLRVACIPVAGDVAVATRAAAAD